MSDSPLIFIEGGHRGLDDLPDLFQDIIKQVQRQSGPKRLCRYEISDGMIEAGTKALNHWMLYYPRESGAELSKAIFQSMIRVWEKENQNAA